MNILFVHQNFPAQFKHLAPALAQQGHRVVAMHLNPCADMPGVQRVHYSVPAQDTKSVHPWLQDLAVKALRGEAAWRVARDLRAQGFVPDVIIAHPAWGESMFLQQVWPQARLGIYCEFFYHASGVDVGFDPDFGPPADDVVCRLQMKNANYGLHFGLAQAGLSPTHWQASLFPKPFAERIRVVHDGIRTDRLQPNSAAKVRIQQPSGVLSLGVEDEVITFVNRNLEPYRGYHQFMRALPRILKARPKAHVLLVGGDGVSYGARPPPKEDGTNNSWRDIFLNEVRADLDMSRVHFVGKVAYADFIALLQISTVHVYLTYPFVLSWSLLEAMSVGCAIVASDTAPVREAIQDNETGRMVDFFDTAALAQSVIELCAAPDERRRLGQQARAFALANYDLHSVCLPQQLQWVQSIADSQAP